MKPPEPAPESYVAAVAEQQVLVVGALIYTADQASKRLGLDEHGEPIKSARWLLDMARAGRISYTRVGKTPCFSERNLLDLVEGGYVPAPNARGGA